jgi:hypothetical protein
MPEEASYRALAACAAQDNAAHIARTPTDRTPALQVFAKPQAFAKPRVFANSAFAEGGAFCFAFKEESLRIEQF